MHNLSTKKLCYVPLNSFDAINVYMRLQFSFRGIRTTLFYVHRAAVELEMNIIKYVCLNK